MAWGVGLGVAADLYSTKLMEVESFKDSPLQGQQQRTGRLLCMSDKLYSYGLLCSTTITFPSQLLQHPLNQLEASHSSEILNRCL
jgi:hypothetical protein